MGFLKEKITKGLISLLLKSEPRIFDLLRYGAESESGETVTPETALKCSAVYSCVGILAESVAMLPLKLYRHRKSGGREEARDHWLWNLLSVAPNKWMTPFEFRENLIQQLALRGNAYCYKVMDNSDKKIYELLPLHPDSVTVRQLANWDLEYTIHFPDGSEKVVDKKYIFHIRYRTLNGYEGISPIAYHRDTIGLAISAMKLGSRQMKNNANPSGVLSIPGALSLEQIMKIRDSWNQTYGSGGQGGTAVLDQGAKFEKIALTNEDLQYLQTRQFQVEDIARIYRVPLHMIQNNQKDTTWGSGIEAMSINFVVYTLMPWLRRFETTIARDLIPKNETDLYAEFVVNGLLRGDSQTRYKNYQVGIMNGFLSPNEVRALENMNPREGGDIYLTPLNMAGGNNTEEGGGKKHDGEK